jgi:hypothetical protein
MVTITMAGKHRTRVVDGEELVSLPGLAAELGRSIMTVRRWIRDGKLPPPDVRITKPGLLKNGAENYYTKQQVERAISAVATEEQRQEAEKARLITKPQARPWQQGEERADKRVRRWSRIESPADEAEQEPEPPLTSERCPHCGGKDIIREFSQIPGARPALREHAWCERCERTITPEPVFDPPPQPNAWANELSVPPPVPTSRIGTRPRGLTSADIRGAVRSQPQSRPKVDLPLPPLE